MTKARAVRVIISSTIACLVGTVSSAPAAFAGVDQASAARGTAQVAVTTITAPTNLRVTRLTTTSVTFQWDHSRDAQPGCTVRIIHYAVFVDGAFRGWTYLGSPVAQVSGLRPGTTHEFTVQGRDNCTGVSSPLSAPLTVTLPR
jgi:hypothetical protein